MATSWPPAAGSYPAWPPVEIPCGGRLEFADIQSGVNLLLRLGFTKANPSAQERQLYFPNNLRCDHGDPCNGLMLVSPQGLRYPFAYCTGANHKAALVLWDVSHGEVPGGSYDLGWGSGVLT